MLIPDPDTDPSLFTIIEKLICDEALNSPPIDTSITEVVDNVRLTLPEVLLSPSSPLPFQPATYRLPSDVNTPTAPGLDAESAPPVTILVSSPSRSWSSFVLV